MNGSASTTIDVKITPKVASVSFSGRPELRATTTSRTSSQNAAPTTQSGTTRAGADRDSAACSMWLSRFR